MEKELIKVLQKSGAEITDERKPLPEILSYRQAVRFVLDLSAQLAHLQENGKGFISITKKQIEIIGENNFIIKDTDIFRVNYDSQLLISKPFTYNSFMAPELKDKKTLPLRVNSNVGFYAICKLAISLLNIDNDINRLRPTKLYFLMDRILVENPEDRVFMYI